MTNVRLGQDYIQRARARLQFVRGMQAAGLHADTVRESQEVVELALKGLARIAGLDVPKRHDIGKLLAAERNRLPPAIVDRLSEVRRISKRLRRERELAFYGDEDFIPSEEYDAEDSAEAVEFAERIVALVEAAQAELGANPRSAAHPVESPENGEESPE